MKSGAKLAPRASPDDPERGVRFKTADGLKKGPLTIGFTGYPGHHHIGPELQFGHVVGDAMGQAMNKLLSASRGQGCRCSERPAVFPILFDDGPGSRLLGDPFRGVAPLP